MKSIRGRIWACNDQSWGVACEVVYLDSPAGVEYLNHRFHVEELTYPNLRLILQRDVDSADDIPAVLIGMAQSFAGIVHVQGGPPP